MSLTYDYELCITIPIADNPRYDEEGLSVNGTVVLQSPASEEAIREWLVNDLAKDHVGKTVTVTHFKLTPTGGAR